MPNTESLLKECRERFTYFVDAWSEIRREGQKDMRYVCGDPWPKDEKDARQATGRPCVALDELNQYCNQLINDVRQNKRAIKVVPKGNGANDESAEFRGNLIREIENKSKAQSAYSWGFQDAVQRSYGYCRISKRYLPPPSFDQELLIKRIPNPDTVWVDPDAKESDFSDMKGAFIAEMWRGSEFRRKFPKATATNFSHELVADYPQWFRTDGGVQVAEYWRREGQRRELLMLDVGAPGNAGLTVYHDELGKGAEVHDSMVFVRGGVQLEDGMILPAGGYKVLNSRTCEEETVCQYLTNGVEILETNPWDGRYIPIIVFLGKEMFVDFGDGPKRIILSLVRLARDPYLLYCYTRTTQLELAGMAPKVPAIGYEGQFEGHEDKWKNINRVPLAYLEVKAVTDLTGGQILPLPQWNRWEPPLQQYEMLAESAKRAIQSACGMYNASVGRQDSQAKSGVAIKALDTQSSQGSYHFIDNYDRALEHAGRILDDLLDSTYDTARDVGIRKANEEHSVVRINEPYEDPKTGKTTHYRTDQGDHDVTITVGPSYESQREEATDFANLLAQNEAIFPRIADLVVKLRNLGPIGDEIAKRLTPPDVAAEQQGQQPLPPAVQQMIAQLKQQLETTEAFARDLHQQIQTKQVEAESKEKIAVLQESEATKRTEMQEETKRTIALAQLHAEEGIQLLKAELARMDAQMSQIQERIGREYDMDAQDRQQQHEAQLQAEAQAHEADTQDRQQSHEAQLAEQQAAAAAEQARQQPQE